MSLGGAGKLGVVVTEDSGLCGGPRRFQDDAVDPEIHGKLGFWRIFSDSGGNLVNLAKIKIIQRKTTLIQRK